MVFVDRDNWYADDDGLSKKICEITPAYLRGTEDINSNSQECCSCDEAKYTVRSTWRYLQQHLLTNTCNRSFVDFRWFLKVSGRVQHIRRISPRTYGWHISLTLSEQHTETISPSGEKDKSLRTVSGRLLSGVAQEDWKLSWEVR